MDKLGSQWIEEPRWRYRFDAFGRALTLLRTGLELVEERPVTELEREGLIQRFEYTWELGWNLLGDYLAYQGVVLPTRTPRSVIKAAYERGVIADGTEWLKALDARNRMAHTYSPTAFEEVLTAIRARYFALLDALWNSLVGEAIAADEGRDGNA